MGGELRCPMCGQRFEPGVSRWSWHPALSAFVWWHRQPYRGRRHARACGYRATGRIADVYGWPGTARAGDEAA